VHQLLLSTVDVRLVLSLNRSAGKRNRKENQYEDAIAAGCISIYLSGSLVISFAVICMVLRRLENLIAILHFPTLDRQVAWLVLSFKSIGVRLRTFFQ